MIYVERRTQNSESQIRIVETVTQPLYQAASDWDCFSDKFEPSFRRNFLIRNGNNSVCDHMIYVQNRTATKREADLFNHEYDYRPTWTT